MPTADNYVRQGVTTLAEGPDGSSPIPIGAFLKEVDAARIAPNFATFVGQGSVGREVMGAVNRRATPAEIERMKQLVRQGMHAPAISGFVVSGHMRGHDEQGVVRASYRLSAIVHRRSPGAELGCMYTAWLNRPCA